MLRCTSNLSRSTFVKHSPRAIPALTASPVHKSPFYHQSLFQSQNNSAPIKGGESNIMAGSALDQLKDLMAMIDEFETNIAQSSSPSSSQRQHQSSAPQSHSQQQQQNVNLPSFLMNSHIPLSPSPEISDSIYPHNFRHKIQ